MKKKPILFIDGKVGTTGLQIEQRLKNHGGVNLLTLPDSQRKNLQARMDLIHRADLSFLCLPDLASKELMEALGNSPDKIIDASSIHRIDPSWIYGLPELGNRQREQIQDCSRLANPGCYATGAILLIAPLVEASVINKEASLCLYGFSGYSGGGKKLIEAYQCNPSAFSSYGLDFQHKHIPEITRITGLTKEPLFIPSVINCYQGMLVTLSLQKQQFESKHIKEVLLEKYDNEPFVRVEDVKENKELFLSIEGLENTNNCSIYLYESKDCEKIFLAAKLDNLGKGASGAAVQNMNLMLGLPETHGLI